MDRETAHRILSQVRAERVKAADGDLATAVHQMHNQGLKAEALHDVGNLALLTLGAGAAGRGLTGLYNLLTRRHRRPATRSGPVDLPLPYPAVPKQASWADEVGTFLRGDQATTKSGLPWYGPAMLFTGMAGLAGGWKGMDAALDARRKAEREHELEGARREFHDALLSQYERPRETPHALPHAKAAGDASAMAQAGAALDRAFDHLTKAATTAADVGGSALGGYGMYAGLTGLLAGAMVYDKTRKRSQSAIIQKALQRRERQRLLSQPPEVYARPEPFFHEPEEPAP